MNKWLLLVVVTLAAWIQAYLFASLSAWHGIVNLLLPLLLAITITRSPIYSLVVALWAGWWLDVASSGPTGVHMLFYATLVLIILWLRHSGVELNRVAVVTVVIALGTLVYHNWLVMVSWVNTGSPIWQPQLWRSWLLDMLMAWLMAALVGRRLIKRLTPREGW